MNKTIWVYGYYGTSMDRASAIVKTGFNPSNNEYDWLGKGIYFWEEAPKRAWQWAQSNIQIAILDSSLIEELYILTIDYI